MLFHSRPALLKCDVGTFVPDAILDGHLPIIFGPDLGCDSPQIPRLAWGSLLVFQCFGALCIMDQLVQGGMCVGGIVLVACRIDGTLVRGAKSLNCRFKRSKNGLHVSCTGKAFRPHQCHAP
jgi:hypothetical protein